MYEIRHGRENVGLPSIMLDTAECSCDYSVVATGWSVNFAPTDPSVLLAAAGAATDLPYATLDSPFTIGHFANIIVSLKYTNGDDVDLIRHNYAMMAYDVSSLLSFLLTLFIRCAIFPSN